MAEFTSNYGLIKPDFNTSVWHDEVNDNFELLDAILFAFTGLQNFVGVWTNSTIYLVGNRVFDEVGGSIWQCRVAHTSAAEDSFEADRTNNPTFWLRVTSIPLVRGAWANDTIYLNGEIAYDASEGVFGRASIEHTSLSAPSTMRDDAANWEFFFDLQAAISANQIGFVPAGGIAATDVQAAIEEVEADYEAADAVIISNYQAADADIIADQIEAGTVMLFQQSAAPTGWTKLTTHSNKALRVVSGAAGSGGSTPFTSVFTARTISKSNLPNYNLSHNLNAESHDHPISGQHRDPNNNVGSLQTGGGTSAANNANRDIATNVSVGNSGALDVSGTISLGGSGVAMNFDVQFVDVILAEKN